jgi:hypothetical protein
MSDNLTALFAGNGKPPGDDLDALFGLPDPAPLPAGWHACEFIRGGVGQSKNGKQRFELRAKLTEGEHAGRVVYDDFYLTPAAWWKSKPILDKLEIKSPGRVRRGLPPGLLGRVRLVIEERDGVRRNKICDVELTGRKPHDAPFAPATSTTATAASEGGSPATGTRGDANEHPADRRAAADQLSFSFGANADGPYGGERP